MDKNALRKLSYGVYVVSTLDGERPTGCVANSIMQITSSPATIAVSINHENFTNSCIKDKKQFAISVLTEQTNMSIIGTFGFQSGKEIDKFENIKYSIKSNMPVLDESCAYIICNVVDVLETSTHTIFLGEVVDANELNKQTPMTYSYYHSVKNGKSPKNAPTYIEENNIEINNQSKYVCSVCGYVYDGNIPFEELPDSYVCPICKQPKSVFVKK